MKWSAIVIDLRVSCEKEKLAKRKYTESALNASEVDQ